MSDVDMTADVTTARSELAPQPDKSLERGKVQCAMDIRIGTVMVQDQRQPAPKRSGVTSALHTFSRHKVSGRRRLSRRRRSILTPTTFPTYDLLSAILLACVRNHERF